MATLVHDELTDEEAGARSHARRAADLARPIQWAREDRATLSEFMRVREKAKVLGIESVTPEEHERCRRYVEHEKRIVQDGLNATRIYDSLPANQRRYFRGWRAPDFLAYRRREAAPPRQPSRGANGRAPRRSVRSSPKRANAPPSQGDDPEPPPSEPWDYVGLASRRMIERVRRREARWRRGAFA